MKHPVSREVFAYWHRLRGDRAAPERRDLDPAALRRVLADLFILGVDGTGTPGFSVRLAGGRLGALFDTSLTGASLPDLFGGADRREVSRVLGDVVDRQAPALAGITAAPPGDARPVALEMLLLPLRHRGKTHARILGSAAPFAVPSWLGLMPVDRLALVSVRFPQPDGSDFLAEAAALPRRAHLIVHEGGRP